MKAKLAAELDGALRPRWVAAFGVTVIPDWLPASEVRSVSVAVIDCPPAVFKAALKTCTPLSPPAPVVKG